MIHFGVCLPQDGLTYGEIKQVARKSEQLGFNSIWFYDHLHSFPRPDQNPFLECWTLLSALAEATNTIRLGTLVVDVQYRNPALLAKMVATLDNISNGRLELGLGAGGTGRAQWAARAGYTPEYIAYGIDFPDKVGVRIARLKEVIQILKKMWTGERVTYEGKFYRVQNAFCIPKPRQKPHPPLWIAGMGERLTLKLVAEFADGCNYSWDLTPEAYREKLNVLQVHCKTFSRSFASIRKSLLSAFVMGKTQSEVQKKVSQMSENCRFISGYVPIALRSSAITGTEEECIQKINKFANAGVNDFMFVFPPVEIERELQYFAQIIMPLFKRVTE